MGRDQSRPSEPRLGKEQALKRFPRGRTGPSGGAGEPKALDSFTHLKICPDFVSICKIIGSIQECIQICRQKAVILRGQRIHVRGGTLGSVFPMTRLKSSPQFSKTSSGTPLDSALLIPLSPRLCPKGHRPRCVSTEQARPTSLPPEPLSPCKLHRGPGWMLLHLGRKHFSEGTLKKAKRWPRDILAANRVNARLH